jgi:hypothetical protein
VQWRAEAGHHELCASRHCMRVACWSLVRLRQSLASMAGMARSDWTNVECSLLNHVTQCTKPVFFALSAPHRLQAVTPRSAATAVQRRAVPLLLLRAHWCCGLLVGVVACCRSRGHRAGLRTTYLHVHTLDAAAVLPDSNVLTESGGKHTRECKAECNECICSCGLVYSPLAGALADHISRRPLQGAAGRHTGHHGSGSRGAAGEDRRAGGCPQGRPRHRRGERPRCHRNACATLLCGRQPCGEQHMHGV